MDMFPREEEDKGGRGKETKGLKRTMVPSREIKLGK